MNEAVQYFIETNLDKIDANDFTTIYAKAEMTNFAYIGELTSTFYEAGIDPLEHLDGYIPGRFFDYQYLPDTYSIPKGITSIGNRAFRGVENVETIYIPESCVFISDHAFRDSETLADLYIPRSVDNIMSNAIDDDIVIHCEKDSYAESFAKSWGYRYKTDYKYIEVK